MQVAHLASCVLERTKEASNHEGGKDAPPNHGITFRRQLVFLKDAMDRRSHQLVLVIPKKGSFLLQAFSVCSSKDCYFDDG